MTDEITVEVEANEATQNNEVEDTKAVEETPSESNADDNENVVEERELTIEEKIAQAVKEAEERVKGATQKRIDRLTYEARSKEEELLKYQQQLEQYKPKEDPLPKEDDFDTFEAWQDAVVEYKANQKLKEIEMKRNQDLAMQKQREVMEAGRKRFEAIEAEYKATNPEYDENAQKFMDISQEIVRSKGGQNPTISAIGQVLTEIKEAPALINYLGQNEELVFELANKTPVSAAFELFKLSQELSQPSETKKQSMPKPVTPVKATGKVAKDPYNGDVLKNLGLK